MDPLFIGRSFRALRIRRRLRQEDLAAEAKVSRAKVCRVETGRFVRMPVGDLAAIAAALGADLDVRLRWRGELLDRLLDGAHASLGTAVVEHLRRLGWETAVEVTFAIGAERGSVDILAWHESTRTLLVVEVKSVIPDVQSMLASHDRKLRLGRRIGLARGWDPRQVARLLVVGESSTSRARVRRFHAVFDAAYPVQGQAVRRWLAAPGHGGGGSAASGSVSGLLFLQYVHPLSGMSGPAARQRVRKRDRLPPNRSTPHE